MATFTSNYAWTKPAGSDPVDISVLNDNLDSQDGIMHDAFLNMADPFSESSTYAVGDIVLYGTKTYRCRVAVTTAGSWTGAANWDEHKISALDLDNAPTDGSNNPVKSDGIYDSEKDIYAVMGQMGAKNLLAESAISTEINGVTFTVNDDGTISTSGTSTSDFSTYIIGTANLKVGQKYIISGSEADTTNKYYIRIRGANDTSENYYNITEPVEFTAGQSLYNVNLRIYNNINMNGVKLYPMIRLASDTDDTYQPYAKTNKQLTDAVSSILTEQDSIETELDTKADKTATASGETLALVPTSEGRALLHTAYGMSTQDGTPTPSSPVDIVSAKADFRSVGKNLLHISFISTTKPYNGINFINNGDGTFRVYGTSTDACYVALCGSGDNGYIDARPYVNKNIWLYVDIEPTGNRDSWYIGAYTYETKGTLVWGSEATPTYNPRYIPEVYNNKQRNYIVPWIRVDKANVSIDITFRPMLFFTEKSINIVSAAKLYAEQSIESYKESLSTTDLTLRAIEVTSSDAYNLVRDNKYYIADTLDYTEDDGFVVTRRIGEKIYVGSEDEDWRKDTAQYGNGKFIGVPEANQWTTTNVAYTAFMYNLSDIKLSRTAYYATPFVTPAFAMFKSNSLNMQGLAIRTTDTVEMDITQFKTWLSTNNIQLDYILATPTTETITTAQALALLGLKTYDESTTISSQAEPSCTIAVEYAKERLGALALTAYNTAKGNDLRITALES